MYVIGQRSHEIRVREVRLFEHTGTQGLASTTCRDVGDSCSLTDNLERDKFVYVVGATVPNPSVNGDLSHLKK